MTTRKSSSKPTPPPIPESEDKFVDHQVADMGTAERVGARVTHESMHEAREAELDRPDRQTVSDYVYRLPTNLDAPEPRPGYVQRWVRAELRSEGDNLNWQQKLREGWRPRDPKTVNSSDYYFGEGSKTGQDVIKVGGLILMEMPEAHVAAKRRAIDEQTRRQEQSVSMETDRASAEGVSQGHSPIRREHTTTASTGRRPPSLAD